MEKSVSSSGVEHNSNKLLLENLNVKGISNSHGSVNSSLYSLRTHSSVDPLSPPVQKIRRHNQASNETEVVPPIVPFPARRNSNADFVGLYDFEKTLGSGHFAVVKLARHVFSGEKVAVKIIDKSKMNEESKQHLFEEVRIMKILNHPNVLKLYEVVDTPTKLYLILEYASGGDLFDYVVKNGPLKNDFARAIFRQIVYGVDYCHYHHVVHRDLKPENILFCSPDHVKISDFGFGTFHAPGEKLSTACGSLAYSAPELLIEDAYDGRAVDIWSLGVVLYMLVTGKLPFQEANPSETISLIMQGRFSIPPQIGKDCSELIEKILKVNVGERCTLLDIKQSKWINKGYDNMLEASELVFEQEKLPSELQEIVFSKLEEIGIKREEVKRSLRKDLYDHVSATYHLLVHQELLKKVSKNSLSLLVGSPKCRRNTSAVISSSDKFGQSISIFAGPEKSKPKSAKSSRTSLTSGDRSDSDPNPSPSNPRLVNLVQYTLSPRDTPPSLRNPGLRQSSSMESLGNILHRPQPEPLILHPPTISPPNPASPTPVTMKSLIPPLSEDIQSRSYSSSESGLERSNLKYISEEVEFEENENFPKKANGLQDVNPGEGLYNHHSIPSSQKENLKTQKNDGCGKEIESNPPIFSSTTNLGISKIPPTSTKKKILCSGLCQLL